MAVDVEFGDLGSAAGEHDGVLTANDGGPPVAEQECFGVVGVGADRDAPVFLVGVEGFGGVAITQVAQGIAFPFLLLAAVVVQLDRRLP